MSTNIDVEFFDLDLYTLPDEAAARLTNLANRLGITPSQLLEKIASDRNLMDYIAITLTQPIRQQEIPLRLRPSVVVSEEIAVITFVDRTILTKLPYPDERFAEAVKSLRYRWNGTWWQREISKFSEPLIDRAVELGCHILKAGFPVEVRSEELYRRIIAGEYKPEVWTWVKSLTRGKYAGWFEITWDRNGKSYAKQASLIRGGRCYQAASLVPATAFDEVMDFARVHGFSVSDGAFDLAAKARRERAAMFLVDPVIREPEPAPEPQISDEIPEGILDELADEPL